MAINPILQAAAKKTVQPVKSGNATVATPAPGTVTLLTTDPNNSKYRWIDPWDSGAPLNFQSENATGTDGAIGGVTQKFYDSEKMGGNKGQFRAPEQFSGFTPENLKKAGLDPNGNYVAGAIEAGNGGEVLNTLYQKGSKGELIPIGSYKNKEQGFNSFFKEGLGFLASALATPVLGPTLTAAYGGGLAGTVGAGATIGAGQAALTGQNIVKGAVTGGIGAGAAPLLSSALTPVLGSNANLLSKIVSGGITSKLGGGDFLTGAVGGGISGGINSFAPSMNNFAPLLKFILTQAFAPQKPKKP